MPLYKVLFVLERVEWNLLYKNSRLGRMDSRERVKSCSTFPFFGCFDNAGRLKDTEGRPMVVVNCGAKCVRFKPIVLVRRHRIAKFGFLHSQMRIKRVSIPHLTGTFEQNLDIPVSCCVDF